MDKVEEKFMKLIEDQENGDFDLERMRDISKRNKAHNLDTVPIYSYHSSISCELEGEVVRESGDLRFIFRVRRHQGRDLLSLRRQLGPDLRRRLRRPPGQGRGLLDRTNEDRLLRTQGQGQGHPQRGVQVKH